MKIQEALDNYLNFLITDRSPQTIAWYRKRLRPLRSIQADLSAITLTELNRTYALLANRNARWVDHPSGRTSIKGGLAPATLRGYVRAWRAFFNWCVDAGFLANSPAHKLQLPPVPKQPPKAIGKSDLDRLVEAARESSARDYAIVCVLADSACRAGGLCAITLDNLDLEQRQAIVISKRQTAFVLFTARTAEAIRAYLRERPAVSYREVFIGARGIPLQPGGVHALLDRLAETAGISGRHNPHAFRHGWAREALRRGADISDVSHVLGHSQIQTTYEFYGRWENAELHAIQERFTNLRPERVSY